MNTQKKCRTYTQRTQPTATTTAHRHTSSRPHPLVQTSGPLGCSSMYSRCSSSSAGTPAGAMQLDREGGGGGWDAILIWARPASPLFDITCHRHESFRGNQKNSNLVEETCSCFVETTPSTLSSNGTAAARYVHVGAWKKLSLSRFSHNHRRYVRHCHPRFRKNPDSAILWLIWLNLGLNLGWLLLHTPSRSVCLFPSSCCQYLRAYGGMRLCACSCARDCSLIDVRLDAHHCLTGRERKGKLGNTAAQ